VILAWALRLALFAQSSGQPQVEVPVLDSRFYLEAGEAIAAGEGLPDTPYFMSPGYTWFIAAHTAMFGLVKEAVVVSQILLDGLTCLLAGLFAARLWGRAAGLTAALLYALLGHQIFSSTRLLPETLAAFLAMSFLWVLSEGRASLRRLAAAGILLGLLATVRSNVLFFLPFAVVALWSKREGARGWLRRSAALCGGTLLAVLPATVRNLAVSGELVGLTTSAGVNFYIGNAAGSDGRFISLNQLPLAPGRFSDDPSGGHFERSVRAFAEEKEGRALSASETSSFYWRLAWEEIGRDPLGWLGLLLRKAFLFVNAFEIPQVDNVYFLARYLPLIDGPLVGLSRLFWALGLFGVALCTVRRPRPRFALLFFAAYGLSVVLFFVTARFRLPIVPLLACFAGAAVAWASEAVRARRVRVILAGGAALVACAVLCNLNPGLGRRRPVEGTAQSWFRPDPDYLDFASQHNNAAGRCLERGDAAGAAREARAGLALSPRHPTLFYNLGRALESSGDLRGAMGAFARALEGNPGNADAASRLGLLRYRAGELDSARTALELAVRSAPSNADAWNTLGAARFKLGDVERARVAFAQAVRLAPRWTEPRFNGALLLSKLGRHEEAAAELRGLHRGAPKSGLFAATLATELVASGQFEEATPLLEGVLRGAPDQVQAMLDLAEVRLARGAVGEARTLVDHALRVAPQSARGLALRRRLDAAATAKRP
jgi:tetratricopeptide (TPR) repeat protein